MERVFRIAAAGEHLGLKPNSIYRLVHSGELQAVQIMRGILGVRESELTRYLESRPAAVPNAARVSAALASPLHGRAGRVSQGVGDAA